MWILRVAAFSLRHADLFATGKYEFFTLGKKAMSRELGARARLLHPKRTRELCNGNNACNLIVKAKR